MRTLRLKTVMLPQRNQKDFEEIPEAVRNQLQFIWLENVDEALKHAIEDKSVDAELIH